MTCAVGSSSAAQWQANLPLLDHLFVPMAASQQQLLRQAWLHGRRGCLSARSEAKAWALRELWLAEGSDAWGVNAFVAARVQWF